MTETAAYKTNYTRAPPPAVYGPVHARRRLPRPSFPSVAPRRRTPLSLSLDLYCQKHNECAVPVTFVPFAVHGQKWQTVLFYSPPTHRPIILLSNPKLKLKKIVEIYRIVVATIVLFDPENPSTVRFRFKTMGKRRLLRNLNFFFFFEIVFDSNLRGYRPPMVVTTIPFALDSPRPIDTINHLFVFWTAL